MRPEELFHNLRMYFTPGIGHITIKRLIRHCGSAEAVYAEKKKALLKIEGINRAVLEKLFVQADNQLIEEEIKRMEKLGIKYCTFHDNEYPVALQHCTDSPFMLFFRGRLPSPHHRIISVVGTRSATEYGKECCNRLIQDFAGHDITIVSGFAYGIDITAHLAAIEHQIETIAVVAHGFGFMYPSLHRKYVSDLLKNGGIITEYPSMVKPDKENFPMRNRIIAGLAEATIVVEASEKGGALITARIANSYHRDVYAFPGRTSDPYSKGCNRLIKNNEAILVESADDILIALGMKLKKKKPAIQSRLFIELDQDEKILVELLQPVDNMGIDDLSLHAGFPSSKTASLLLSLEMKGLIHSIPGKKFKLMGS
ncbi:MAG: DNA-protecting protein DprA [Candidatus Competibacteraceae bacterium]|nr:DNA-protecting protein DprA [Candidatus Competibacteraceae bacterium]